MDDKVFDADKLNLLPLGVDDFTELRNANKIYVDKTEQIYSLAVYHGYFCLSRPRRFGKTLLVSAFESLFKYGLRDFKGLAIEKLWDDHTYPVIRINFALCKNFHDIDDFKVQMDEVVTAAFEKAGVPLASEVCSSRSLTLRIVACFQRLENVNPVLLLDEHDAPINVCIDNEELFKSVRREMSSFFTAIKSISGKLRFFFYTGICSYKNLSIFSDNNYVTDISLDSKYGSLLGFTEEEIREYFMPFVENAARELGISTEECFAALKRHYEGYSFDRRTSTHVHTPWSVLSFLRNPKEGFRNYWNETAGCPSVLLNYISKHVLQAPFAYGKNIYMNIGYTDFSGGDDEREDYALLYQTGYLTLIECWSWDVVLNYPNEEIRSSIAKFYADQIFSISSPYARIGMNALKLFSTVALDDIPQKLNEVISCIDYNRFPIKDEADLVSFLLVYAYSGGVDAIAQEDNFDILSKIEFATGNRYFAFVLKAVADKKDAPAKLDEAVAQIKEQHYGEGNSQGLELVRMAMVFSLADRGFAASRAF